MCMIANRLRVQTPLTQHLGLPQPMKLHPVHHPSRNSYQVTARTPYMECRSKIRDGYSYGRWWINQSTPCESTSSRFFRHWTVQTGHLFPRRGSIRVLLLAPSLTPSRHDTPPTSGLQGAQAETGGNGQESTSRAVHRRLVLPAAIAGVRCR